MVSGIFATNAVRETGVAEIFVAVAARDDEQPIAVARRRRDHVHERLLVLEREPVVRRVVVRARRVMNIRRGFDAREEANVARVPVRNT